MSKLNIAIEVYSLFITVILMICNALSRQRSNRSRREIIMGLMLRANLVVTVAFIGLVAVDGNAEQAMLNRFLTGICYAFGAVLSELYGEYVLCIVAEKQQVPKQITLALRIVCALAFVLDLVSIFNGMYFDVANGYHIRGRYFLFNQFMVLLIMLCETAYVIAKRKALGKDAFVLAMYGVVPMLSIVLQIYVNRYVLMYPAITLSLLIIYVVTYINQAHLLDRRNSELSEALKTADDAKKEAISANIAKTEFLTHMSHDIRTPINGITGMTAIARRNIDSREKVEECLHKIDISSGYLLALINNVLDMSKLELGKTELAEEPFSLYDVLSDCRDVIESQASEKGISYTSHVRDIPYPYLIGSTLCLRQIINNITSNAVKYNRKGGTIDTYVSLDHADADTAVYRFQVIDTGIGMSEEFQAHLFEPFSQENSGARTEYSGTGLGLSIVHELVAQMKGTIDISSRRNTGTTVTVIIPFRIDHSPHAPEKKAPAEASIDLSGMRILVAEDNSINLDIVRYFLEDAGVTVLTATDGSEAVRLFEASAPASIDAILMDIMMPVMDGYEAARKIRASSHPDAASVPIIAMTANAFSEDVRKALDAGMNAHIAKPLDTEKMKEVIAENVHLKQNTD